MSVDTIVLYRLHCQPLKREKGGYNVFTINSVQTDRDWETKKGILDNGDTKTQYIKLLEETGELAQAILKNDRAEFIDAIGDCVVVLTNLAELGNVDIEHCIDEAYSQISNRTGRMVNGTFVKDK